MSDDFQTYRSKSSRKRKADQMDVDPAEELVEDKKRVEFKAMSNKDMEQQVSHNQRQLTTKIVFPRLLVV